MNHIQSNTQKKHSLGLKVNPMLMSGFSIQQLFEHGNKLHKSGDISEAETVFRNILEIAPEHPGALHFLGVIARQCGELDNAEQLIKKAIKIAPNYHTAHNNLGKVYQDLGQIENAVKAFKRAAKENSNYAIAHFNLGIIFKEQRKFEDAINQFKTSAKLNPHHLESHLEIGSLYQSEGEKFNAQIAFKTVLHLDETNIEARCKLAQTIESLNQTDEALKDYQIALDYRPESTQALNGIGRLYHKNGQFKDALEHLNKALSFNQHNTETLNNLGSAYQSIGEINNACLYFGRVLELAPNAYFAEKCLLFAALNNYNYSTDELFNLHVKLRSRHDKPKFTKKIFPKKSKAPNRRLKIGYLSSDFRTHVVALNILPLIANHDHDNFEIFLYYHSKNDDLMTKAFSDRADHFKFINTMTDEELAKLIEEDEIDIFVTLAGRFDENRPLVATYRPAPIQISFHDCATSGLAAMDYYLTDNIISPPNTAEKFTEQLFRLPTYYQYPHQEGLPEINECPAIKNEFITFSCFNKPEKIGDEVIKLWAKILRAIPNSQLLLKYFKYYSEPLMQERIIRRFAENNISEDRLILNASQDTHADHLTLYHQVDIALDPFPFNGATTTFEALSMGVPVIALQGDHFVSRVATSLVSHAGHPELAAENFDQYVDIAVRLSSDVNSLNMTRQNLRHQLLRSSICNAVEYVKNVESAFRKMWVTWCKTGGYKGN